MGKAKDKDENLAAQIDENNLRAAGHEGMLGTDGTVGVNGELAKNDELKADVTINDPTKHVAEARDAVQRRQDELSARNEEGHAKNMAKIEEANANRETVDTEDGPVAAPDPRLGREDNGNTPVVHPDGSKSWHPPGVAGVRK